MSPRPPLLLAAAAVLSVLALAAPPAGEAHAQSAPPPPAPNGTLSAPAAVIMLDSGMLYVADTGNDRIQVFHPNGTFAFAFGESGSGDGQLDAPEGIYLSRWRQYIGVTYPAMLYVADTGNDRIQVFHPNGTFAFAFGESGSGDGQLSEPAAVSIMGYVVSLVGTTLMVADTGNDRIQLFGLDGTFIDKFGTKGSASPTRETFFNRSLLQFDGPKSVAQTRLLGEVIMVADTGNDRIQVIDPVWNKTEWLFNYKDTYGSPGSGPGQFDGPRSIVFGGLNNIDIMVADTGNDRIQVLWATGHFIREFGTSGTGNGEFMSPAGAAMTHPFGAFAVADTGNDRVQVFHPNGTLRFEIGPAPSNGTAAPPPAPPGNGTAAPPPAPPGNGTAAPPPAPVTVVIEQGAVAAGPLNFTGAGHAANLTIDVAGLAGAGGPPLDGSASSTVTFPPSETSVVASFATVTFPPGVTAAHVPAGGRLALHVAADMPDDARVQGALAYEGSGRVALQRVVEVGGASGRVTFDIPVRILLEGQAGGRAFYIEGGAITPIDQVCAADDVARVHRHMAGAGECQIDSADGGKIIYTYHLTRFGTALPVGAAPPPVVHTCSVSLDMPSLVMVDVRPGGLSDPVRQTVINSGSAPFARVDLAATMWRAGPSQGADAPAPLPASATEISTAAAGGPYTALVNGTAVAHDRKDGDGKSPLWFLLNLTSYGDARGGTLVQEVTYQATCDMP